MSGDPVDAVLADLAILAVKRLQTEMGTAKNSKDRIAAANSILDRLGYSRTARAQADTSDREIRRALESLRDGKVNPAVQGELESMAEEQAERFRKQQAAEEQERFEQEQALADARRAAEWDAADPKRQTLVVEATDEQIRDAVKALDTSSNDEPEEDEDEGIRDFSQLGDDGEERDAWLNS